MRLSSIIRQIKAFSGHLQSVSWACKSKNGSGPFPRLMNTCSFYFVSHWRVPSVSAVNDLDWRVTCVMALDCYMTVFIVHWLFIASQFHGPEEMLVSSLTTVVAYRIFFFLSPELPCALTVVWKTVPEQSSRQSWILIAYRLKPTFWEAALTKLLIPISLQH